MRLTRLFAPGVVAVLTLCLAAFAQPAPDFDPNNDTGGETPDADSASRGVARISLMNGDVSVRRGDSGDYVAAAINAPLVAGDRVLTGPHSRAEVQFDYANMIRIGADAEVRLAELGDRRYLVQIAHGYATFRVLRSSQADVEISLPQVSIRPRGEGVYRVAAREDGESEITVRDGSVEIFTPRGTETLRAGRTMRIRGTIADPEYQVSRAYGEDEWDRWNRNRDSDLERSQSYRYVDSDVYGADDLDNYGSWVNDGTYGNVWAPRVAGGWAPYQAGRWVWLDWYGWSWVSYDPWGWAPYHYGRWYQSPRYGWCWWPGRRGFGARHYWSPGLVAFVGFGRGGGVGVGFGQIGWVPLAPYERYHRWYGRGFYGGNRGFNNVTIVNNVNIHNSYRNARAINGITAIDRDGFGRGRAGRPFRGSEDDFRGASLVRGQLPVGPERESLRLSDRESRLAGRRGGERERFFSRREPRQIERVPFDEQRRRFSEVRAQGWGADDGAIRRDGSQRLGAQAESGQERRIPGDRAQGSRGGDDGAIRRDGSQRLAAQAARQEDGQERRGNSWRRFGDPTTGTPERNERWRSRPEQGSAEGGERGWGRFGEPGRSVDRDGRGAESEPRGGQTNGFARTERNESRRQERESRGQGNGVTWQDRGADRRIDRGVERQREPARISAPEIRQRSIPRMENRAPRMERAPVDRGDRGAMRAPRSESPRGGGAGGGGGGGRQGGGGGGGRQGGGGGRNR